MANPNPHTARQALKLKRRRKAGDLSDALLIQWRALKAAETAMYAAGKGGDIKATLRAVHAITCPTYPPLLKPWNASATWS